MTQSLAPALAALVLLGLSAAIGIAPIRKLIQVVEAKHELKHGSAGFLRTMKGWSLIAFWLMATWFIATILGDWSVSGDLGAAIDRGWLRLQVLLEIAAALADND